MYRVLVADDEPIILSGIRHMIDWEKEEAEIVGVARNGAEAYSIIEKEHPDIVITDIRMPLMDGISLVGKCSTAYPDIVFIILTSLAEFSLAREAVGFGVTKQRKSVPDAQVFPSPAGKKMMPFLPYPACSFLGTFRQKQRISFIETDFSHHML